MAPPIVTWPWFVTVIMVVAVAIVRRAPAAGVPVPIASEPDEFTRNLVAPFSWKFRRSPRYPEAALSPR